MRPVSVLPDRRALCLLLAIAVLAAIATLAPADAAHAARNQTYPRSAEVALVPNDGDGGDGGILPTYGTVTGRSGESFDGFDFTDLGIDELDTATLAGYDTVVLNQVFTSDLDQSSRQALAAFVTGGGKLIIHDSDATDANDYTWLPAPARTGRSCQNCGEMGGHAVVVENNNMVSAVPTDPSYVNVAELPGNTDAVGDANLMVSQNDGWFRDIIATNGNGDTGAVHTYATVGGLIIFNGFDTDDIGETQDSGVDWISHMWYRELAQGWSPDGLPHSTPLNCSNTVGSVSPTSALVPMAGKTGQTITITGKNFCPGTRVQFGNSKAIVDATVANTGQMSVVVPRNATSNIMLINPDGQSGPVATLAIDSYRNLHGFNFLNYGGDRGGLTEADLRTVFGNNAFTTWKPCGGCAPATKLTQAAQDIFDQNRSFGGGLCFGFTVASLRLGTGVDALNNASANRSDPGWNTASVYALPGFYQGTSAYADQMRHYLYAWQVSQDSSEFANPVDAYIKAVKKASNKAAYMLQSFQAAIKDGPALVTMQQHYVDPSRANLWHQWFGGIIGDGAPNAWDGHALVVLDVETHPDGGFDVDVSDPNKPWDSARRDDLSKNYNEDAADGNDHDAALAWSKIHVDSSGHWSYDGNFGGPAGMSWSGDPQSLRPLSFTTIKGGALKPFSGGVANNALVSGAAIGQVTDSHGATLYDASGQVRQDAQAADAAVLAQAATTPAGTGSTRPPAVLLDSAQTYTMQTAPGAYQVAAGGLDAEAQMVSAGSLTVHANAGAVTVAPRSAGNASLQITRTSGGRQLTVGVSGHVSGPVTVTVGRTVTVNSRKAGRVTVTVSRSGAGQAPQAFSASTKLKARQRLTLGSARRLRPAKSLHVKLSGRHARTVTLTNRATSPSAKITKAAYHRKTGTVTVSVRTHGAVGGRVVVAVRAGKRRATITATVAKGTTKTVVALGAVARRSHIRIVAVAASRRGQAGKAARRTVTAS